MTSSYYMLQDIMLASVYSHATCLMLGGVPHVVATKGTSIGIFAARLAGDGGLRGDGGMEPLWEEDLGLCSVGITAACDGSVCMLTDDGGVALVTFDRDANRASIRFHAKLICHDGDGARTPSRGFQPSLRSDDSGSVVVVHAFEGYLHVVKVKLILASQISVPFPAAVQYHRMDKYALSSFCLLPPIQADCQFSYIPIYNPDPSRVAQSKGVVKRHQLAVGVSRGSDLSTVSIKTQGMPCLAVGGSQGNLLGGIVIEGAIVAASAVHLILGISQTVSQERHASFPHNVPDVCSAFIHRDPSNADLPAMTLLSSDGRLYQLLLHNQSDDCERACTLLVPTVAHGPSSSSSSFVPNPNDCYARQGRWVAGIDRESGAPGLMDVANATLTYPNYDAAAEIEARQHICSAVDAGVTIGREGFGAVTDVVVEPPRTAVSALRMAAHSHVTGTFEEEGHRPLWAEWQQVSEHALHEPSTLAVATSARYLRRVTSLFNTDTICTLDIKGTTRAVGVRLLGGSRPTSRVVLSSSSSSRALDICHDAALPPLDTNQATLTSYCTGDGRLSLQVDGEFIKWVRANGEPALTAAVSCTQADVGAVTDEASGATSVLLALATPEGLKTVSYVIEDGRVSVKAPLTLVAVGSVSAVTVAEPALGRFVIPFALWGEEGSFRLYFPSTKEVSRPLTCPLLRSSTVCMLQRVFAGHLLIQVTGGAVFFTRFHFEHFPDKYGGVDWTTKLRGSTTQLLRDDVLPGCVATTAMGNELMIALGLASGPLEIVGVPLHLLAASTLEMAPITSRHFAHPYMTPSNQLTGMEFAGTYDQVNGPLIMQMVLASQKAASVIELRGTCRYFVTSLTRLNPLGCPADAIGGSILKLIPLLPPAFHSIADADTGRGVTSLVALVEAPLSSSYLGLPRYVLSLLNARHDVVGEHALPTNLIASCMAPGLPAGGGTAALPPDPNLADTPITTDNSPSGLMFGIRGDIGKSAVLSYVSIVGGCRAEDGAGFLLPFVTNPFRYLRSAAGALVPTLVEEEAFCLSLPTPVNDMCNLAVEGRPAVAAATHTEIVLCFTDTLPSSFSVYKSLAISSPCLSIRSTANVLAAHSSGLITYYEFQAGGLREKAVEISPFTVVSGMGGVDGYMLKADVQRNLTLTILEDRPSKGASSTSAAPLDRYTLPTKMGTRLECVGLRVVPIGQLCEGSVSVPTTFTFFSSTSDPSLVPNFYARPSRLFNHMLLSPMRSVVRQVFNYNDSFECYYSLLPLSQRFLICGLDGSLKCLTRIPNEASRILQRVATCIDNFNDNTRVDLREGVAEDGSKPHHPGITTVPHYKARRVALDTRTVPESYTIHLRTLQQFVTLPADVRSRLVSAFVQSENASPVTAGSLLELIFACRGLC